MAHSREKDDFDRRQELLGALARTYARPLTRFFSRRVPVQADVPDLLQEVFLRLSRLSDPGAIEHRDSFIFVTAANVLRDQARRDSVRQAGKHDPIEDCDLEGSDFAPDRVLESKQAARLLRAALLELPERTRDIFVLRVLEGMKMVDVARAIGISTRAAEKHQARALVHVAAALRDWRDD
ncbi:MAG: RNA polymerase subunit sigma-24 [Sphingomonas sp. 28-66-16]|nr:MAG: RNA polymerase subunit sigma-24 [Sphingomonas sp. 28-66-16]